MIVTKYLTAIACSVIVLAIMTALMPKKSEPSFFTFRNATWFENDVDPGRPVPPAGTLLKFNSDLKQCCIGLYRYSASTDEIKRSFGSYSGPISLYFSALGGDVELAINGVPVQLPDSDFSSIGPIIPLETKWIDSQTIELQLRLKGPGVGFVGPWKSAPVIGPHFALEEYRAREKHYQVDLPYSTSVPILLFALVFCWFYFGTGRQYEFYKLFAGSLVAVAIFDLYLAGFPRELNFFWGSVTHYPARCMSAIGSLFLVESYLFWNNDQANFPRRLRNSLVIVIILISLIAGVGSATQQPTIDVVACAAATLIGFAPIAAWRLNHTRVLSIRFLIYVIVLTASLGSIADAIKMVTWRFGVSMPFDYFYRFTSPLLVSQTIVVYFSHFIVYFNRCKEQATTISSQKALTTAFQMIAHDVRVPFSRLRMGLSMLEKNSIDFSMPVAIQRLRSEIDRSLRSVEGTLSDILEFGKASPTSTEDLELENLISEALSDLTSLKIYPNIRVEMSMSHSRRVRVDKIRIQRVLLNLLDNAFHASGNGGRLWISTRDQDLATGEPAVEIVVGNTGALIPEARLNLIFEPFKSFGKRHGTGLGLAIARKIVEAHGGQIACQSSEKRGTEFTFVLPAMNP